MSEGCGESVRITGKPDVELAIQYGIAALASPAPVAEPVGHEFACARPGCSLAFMQHRDDADPHPCCCRLPYSHEVHTRREKAEAVPACPNCQRGGRCPDHAVDADLGNDWPATAEGESECIAAQNADKPATATETSTTATSRMMSTPPSTAYTNATNPLMAPKTDVAPPQDAARELLQQARMFLNAEVDYWSRRQEQNEWAMNVVQLVADIDAYLSTPAPVVATPNTDAIGSSVVIPPVVETQPHCERHGFVDVGHRCADFDAMPDQVAPSASVQEPVLGETCEHGVPWAESECALRQVGLPNLPPPLNKTVSALRSHGIDYVQLVTAQAREAELLAHIQHWKDEAMGAAANEGYALSAAKNAEAEASTLRSQVEQLTREAENTRATLAGLASFYGNGPSVEWTSADDMEARIRDGVDRVVRVEKERAAGETWAGLSAALAKAERERDEAKAELSALREKMAAQEPVLQLDATVSLEDHERIITDLRHEHTSSLTAARRDAMEEAAKVADLWNGAAATAIREAAK